MSPALVKKYLDAARRVADHLVLTPDGLAFAPYPMLADTDRDKYCVNRIIAFYNRQKTDYADYFLAAWRFRHRAALGEPGCHAGRNSPMSRGSAASTWRRSGPPSPGRPRRSARSPRSGRCGGACRPPGRGRQARVRAGCERMRDFVVELRGLDSSRRSGT